MAQLDGNISIGSLSVSSHNEDELLIPVMVGQRAGDSQTETS